MEKEVSKFGFILGFISSIYGILIGLILTFLSISMYNYGYFKSTGIALIILGVIILFLSFLMRNKNYLKTSLIVLYILGILETLVSIPLILGVFFAIQGFILLIQGIIIILAGLSVFKSDENKSILLRIFKWISIIALILFVIFIIFVLYQVYYIKSNTKDYHSCSGPDANEECNDIPCPDKPYWHKKCINEALINGRIEGYKCSCFKSGPAM